MEQVVRRIYVEKKKGFDVEAQKLLHDIKSNLIIESLEGIRIANRYDISGISDEEYQKSKSIIFSEPPVDMVYEEDIDIGEDEAVFAIEYLPGQYDQRADSAAQCVQLLTHHEMPVVKHARLVILKGSISRGEVEKIKSYCINSVDSREAGLEKYDSLEENLSMPDDVQMIAGFSGKDKTELQQLWDKLGLAMSLEDFIFCQEYFRDKEKRDPSITEIRVIDTYWSDHCRHTTFLTNIREVKFEKGHYSGTIKKAYEDYLSAREFLYGNNKREISLMDIALLGMKELRKKGMLKDLDESGEINACSINITVDVDGRDEEWILMFKNETHNHPTEIEPFGGAATCLGGAIRDPLSGRAYVYQAMRVTGSGDPRTSIKDTLPGKLTQRKITNGAAAGYSSYGNQIGLATGLVSEVYDEGFVAKRMEIGAVIGAAPKKNVMRETPVSGDKVILLGGRTGRDGCGGATGSSKEHDEESILKCGAEVQKGNPPTERKIQRLFRNPHVSCMIKRCNDFGAGGISVAIGEIAEGLVIDLDMVRRKYEGLDGTELAISESQERMAVVVKSSDTERFIEYANEENLEAVVVAEVTSNDRLIMLWRGKPIVDISREFLNTNGVRQITDVCVISPQVEECYFDKLPDDLKGTNLKERWISNLKRLNVCSQRGLAERFDSTIGLGTVLAPFGGTYQRTPQEVMAAKIPVLSGDTSTGTIMSYGYDPALSRWSPFHGAVYSIVEAVSKIVAAGGDFRNIRLTLQEYFERLGKDPSRWGKPFAALLGALIAQRRLDIPAIGGKDSMSGTFKDMDVPPTLVAFGVVTLDVNRIISCEFKQSGSKVIFIKNKCDEYGIPDFEQLKHNYSKIQEAILKGWVLSSHTVGNGGIAGTVTKMAFGNRIGMEFEIAMDEKRLFAADYGSILLEIKNGAELNSLFDGVEFETIGHTLENEIIYIDRNEFKLSECLKAWEEPLEDIFPTKVNYCNTSIPEINFNKRINIKSSSAFLKPRIFMPVFPGTNCEYDTARAFEKAGGLVNTMVVRNISSKDIEESIETMVEKIRNSQIIMLPGGFSGGDEPDGSGKFIATAFRNPMVSDAVTELLNKRDGLMLGICNGFQALVKLGLLPYGEIRDLDENSPTLTYNTIGRHMSRMVRTKVVSTLSPWFSNVNISDIHTIPVSHGEGRFHANQAELDIMMKNGQIATQYVDYCGIPSMDIEHNPNGSVYAIESLLSPDGRILGKMGHSERVGNNILKNIPGSKEQRIFEAGVNYFK